jgi:hypothetical protein
MGYLNSNVVMWLLLTIVATFTFINFYLFIKLLKKGDEFQIATYEALDLLNNQRIKILKEIEVLQRRSRILNNESKENIRRRA